MTDPTNEERSQRAEAALRFYLGRFVEDGYETGTVDLIADLLHLARRDGYDGEGAIETARMHFQEESR